MKIASFYEKCSPIDHFRYWEDVNGITLPREIAKIFNATIEYHAISQLNQSDYCYDIAYCQMYTIPKQRPAKVIYSFVSDYYDDQILKWIEAVRPNFLFALNGVQDFENRKNRLAKFGCKLIFMPWCCDYIGGEEIRDNDIFISGCINKNYPFRKAAHDYLTSQKNSALKIISSCSDRFGKYSLTNTEYIDMLKRSKIYVAGLIFDELLPPKFIEAAAHDCCIITSTKNERWLKEAGFINGVHYLNVNHPIDIIGMMKIDWTRLVKDIGLHSGILVRQQHTIEQRAKQIAKELQNVDL